MSSPGGPPISQVSADGPANERKFQGTSAYPAVKTGKPDYSEVTIEGNATISNTVFKGRIIPTEPEPYQYPDECAWCQGPIKMMTMLGSEYCCPEHEDADREWWKEWTGK